MKKLISFIGLLITQLMIMGQELNAIPTNGLVFQYSSTWTFDGKPPYLSTPPVIDLNQDYTVSLWVNINTMTPGDQIFLDTFLPIGKGLVYSKGRGFWYSICEKGNADITLNFPVQVNSRQWIHFVLKREGNLNGVYANGILVLKTPDCTVVYPHQLVPLYFGTYSGSGIVSFIKIYNTALSVTDIRSIYLTESPIISSLEVNSGSLSIAISNYSYSTNLWKDVLKTPSNVKVSTQSFYGNTTILQSSTDLQHWTDVNQTSGDQVYSFSITNNPFLFFRLKTIK